MKLHDLLDKDLLGQMEDEGYVHLQVHPSEPLGILNYTDKASWDGVWNDVTLTCRGLIYDMTNYDVLARPFSKFFNYEQFGPEHKFPTSSVEVTDKQDGSLGILYPLPDGSWAVATRGSFASDQALHATRLLNDGLLYPLELDRRVTYLFEIIYPENRIVLNYGDTDELVLLGGVEIESGMSFGPDAAAFMLNWSGPRTKVFPANTLAEALAMPPRENAEGIVVRFFEDDMRVKIKQADYVIAHRVVTGLNDRSIWDVLQSGQDISVLTSIVPEEFIPYVEEVAGALLGSVDKMKQAWYDCFIKITTELGEEFSRRDFALRARDSGNPAVMFKLLDGHDVSSIAWKLVRPEANRNGLQGPDQSG